MKKFFSVSVLVLILSGCSSVSSYHGTVSTKKFDINSPSLAKGENVSYSYKLSANDTGWAAIIDALLSKNKCTVAFNNVTLHKSNKFSSTVDFQGEEVIDRSLPGCK